MANQMADDNYCVIFGWMCNGLKLNSNELLVYAVVYGFSQDGESRYYGGRGFLARTLNISKPTVDKALSSLCEKGFVHRVETERNGVKFHEYYADLQVVKKLYHPNEDDSNSKECLLNSKNTLSNSKECLLNSKESLPNNKVIPNTNEKNNKDSKSNPFETMLKSVPIIKDNADLKQAFLDFIEMRKTIKKPLTDRALKLAINEAYRLSHGEPELMRAIVEQSILHSWQSFYPLKKEDAISPLKSPGNPFGDLLRKEVGG